MVTLALAANTNTRDVIQAAHVTNLGDFIVGTAGYGQLFRPYDINDASHYSTIIGNKDTTNGLALQVQYGDPAGTPVTLATFNKTTIFFNNGLTLTQLSSSSDPGSGKTLIYGGNDGRLYIFPNGGSATRMATYAEVSGSGFIPATPVTAAASADLTLSGSATDITSLSGSLSAGKWLVIMSFDFIESGAGDVGVALIGSITTSGGSATIAPSSSNAIFVPQTASERATLTKSWYVNVTSTTTVKGQGSKSGGSGASKIGVTHTTLVAVQVSN